MKKFSFKNLRISNLTNKDVKIVEKRKWFFIASGILVVLAMIFMGIYWAVLGSPINLGTDFSGAYTIKVVVGSEINDDNYAEYSDKLACIVNNYVYDNGENEYEVCLDKIVRLGTGSSTSFRIDFRAPKGMEKSDLEENLAPDLVDSINDVISFITPDIELDAAGTTATITYNKVVKNFFEQTLEGKLQSANIGFSSKSLSTDFRTVTLNLDQVYEKAELTQALRIDNSSSANAKYTGFASGSVSLRVIYGTISAVAALLIIMFAYAFIRFDLSAALSFIVAPILDLAIMFMLMLIFRVEFGIVIFPAAIMVLVFSAYNSIVNLERIKENTNALILRNKNVTADYVANRTVLDLAPRIVATFSLVFGISCLVAIIGAIGGACAIAFFAVSVMFGTIASFFSSTCFVPSLWALMRKNNLAPHVSKFSAFKRAAKKDDVVVAPSDENSTNQQ